MRITGGTFRSRALRAPRGSATRPTTDRVREALFGILTSAGALASARVVDLYAGTGALGLEALSRGAAHATFVESGREALAALRDNVAALAVERQVIVLGADVAVAAERVARAGPFDLAFADPPWALVDSGDAGAALRALLLAGAFADDAWLVLEHSSRSDPPVIEGFSPTQSRRYGDTTLAFYKTGILAQPRGDT